jgi:hypothetical protein
MVESHAPAALEMAQPARLRRSALLLALLLIGWGVSAGSARASQEITEFTVGSSNTKAGAHPDLTATVRLANPGQPEVASNISVDLPEGLFGNPGAIAKCRAADFVLNHCPAGAQAGLVTLVANYAGDPHYILGVAPIYNMEVVSDDEAARLQFVAPTVNVPVAVPISLRSESDYGLRLSINSISQTVALGSASLVIWGFPAKSEHDAERFPLGSPGSPPGCPGSVVVDCTTAPYPDSGEAVYPFTDNPSVCTPQPLPVHLAVTTYQDPNPSNAQSDYAATTGCEEQKFDPGLQLNLTSAESDAPSGIDIRLKATQFLKGESSTQSNLRSASIILPEGLTINPDAADGQTSCSELQAGFGTPRPGACPDNSKVGTVEVRTPALDGPLVGSLYIGEPRPGNQYRAFMIFDGLGVHAKLPASFLPDSQTGQLTLAVSSLPQVPFERFDLHLFASDRGLLATPTRCGIFTASAMLEPWNGQLSGQSSAPSVDVRSGPNGMPCPGLTRPFHPRLVAGATNPLAGDYSNFLLKLDRDDGDQFLGDLNFRMPPGFTGDLRGIGYCPDTSISAAARSLGRNEQAVSSCPSSSQIGTTNVAAGPGSHPFHAVGKMYLAGPFKGAPLSVVAVTPALAGPYDYGVVVVRVALHIDPQTAQVSAVSDTVPAIIGGIPIRMRSIQVNIDKERFTINPTNCSPFSVDSQGIGDQGTITDFSSYFQAINCGRLPFKPTFAMRQIGGRKSTRRASNPKLRFKLRTRPGDANIKSLTVTLPPAFAIDQRHLGNICSEKELVADQCAGRQAIGRASTATPLLDRPLEGPVFAVSGSGGLPRLAFILDGQVSLVPRAETTTVVSKTGAGKLKTTVPVVPDAPIGEFKLTVFGGRTGYLINTRNLCASTPLSKVSFVGQNGKTRTQNVRVKASCGKRRRP